MESNRPCQRRKEIDVTRGHAGYLTAPSGEERARCGFAALASGPG